VIVTRKKKFVTNQGERLSFKIRTGKVEWKLFFSPNGFTPSVANPSLILGFNCKIRPHWINVMSRTWQNFPFAFLFLLCHLMSLNVVGIQNMQNNHGTNGKCLKVFTTIQDFPYALNLSAPHFGQDSSIAYCFLNKTHPFAQAWMFL